MLYPRLSCAAYLHESLSHTLQQLQHCVVNILLFHYASYCIIRWWLVIFYKSGSGSRSAEKASHGFILTRSFWSWLLFLLTRYMNSVFLLLTTLGRNLPFQFTVKPWGQVFRRGKVNQRRTLRDYTGEPAFLRTELKSSGKTFTKVFVIIKTWSYLTFQPFRSGFSLPCHSAYLINLVFVGNSAGVHEHLLWSPWHGGNHWVH